MQEAHAGRLFDHVGIRVRDVEASRAFYAAVLEPLGLRVAASGDGGFSVDEFFVSGGGTPTAGLHLAFQADSQEVVDRFHAAALAAGAIDNGALSLVAHRRPLCPRRGVGGTIVFGGTYSEVIKQIEEQQRELPA